MAATHLLRVFRMHGDQRVSYVIELDAQRTIVAEYVDQPAAGQAAPVVAAAAPPRDTSPERFKALTMARWSTPTVKENPIPGSEELREEYLRDREKLEASYGSSGCPSCEHGKLIRAFRTKLEARKLL